MQKEVKKKSTRKSLIKSLDDAWRNKVRERGACERCGKDKNLQAAHIISRRNQLVRWDLRNSLLLCKRCHLYWGHKNPMEFAEWVNGDYPGLYQELKRRANEDKKLSDDDLRSILEELKGVKV